jgi:hypothetical protein
MPTRIEDFPGTLNAFVPSSLTDRYCKCVKLLKGGRALMAIWPKTRVEQLARDAKALMTYADSNVLQVTRLAEGLLN